MAVKGARSSARREAGLPLDGHRSEGYSPQRRDAHFRLDAFFSTR